MKKKIISLVLILTLMSIYPIDIFAQQNFNYKVLNVNEVILKQKNEIYLVENIEINRKNMSSLT